ncbi:MULTISPECIES: hypothetical protein [Gracilibacillus]|uniref:hypothetical protein n=1 Tax=Gracilibacillus TaxID=74385 RepID=UPI0015E847AF|nr:hypothetical protein [Gracilibacillus dipsosauri]
MAVVVKDIDTNVTALVKENIAITGAAVVVVTTILIQVHTVISDAGSLEVAVANY